MEKTKNCMLFLTVRVIHFTRFSYLHYHKRSVAKLKVCISHTFYAKFLCKRVCPFQSGLSVKCSEDQAKRLQSQTDRCNPPQKTAFGKDTYFPTRLVQPNFVPYRFMTVPGTKVEGQGANQLT